MIPLRATVAILLFFLPSQVNGQIAACLPGYDWMFSSTGQSPCQVASELGSVCTSPVEFELGPLASGTAYEGPSVADANDCMCSSVYYSLASACAYCQGHHYFAWPTFINNCPTVYVSEFTKPIPSGVAVPLYAYQDISISIMFNVTLAQSSTVASQT